MAKHAVMSWFGRPVQLSDRAPEKPASRKPDVKIDALPPIPLPTKERLDWTPDRLATTDSLWGDGYQFPDGEAETLRLARPMRLSDASSLLLVGAGGGGAVCTVAKKCGAWVSGFEADPKLVAAANDRLARGNLTRRAQIETWDPNDPSFREGFYHHALALEPFHGSDPERILNAIALALKPGGHLVMLEIVANRPLDAADPVIASWARMERRTAAGVPTEAGITRILTSLGYDVRITEDISERHIHQALIGWRSAVRTMESAPPSRRAAMSCVEEAELWLIRVRLFQSGLLRLVRWHAIGSG